ncbi:hypothetical protein MASR2M16_26070 [Thauera terpenica]
MHKYTTESGVALTDVRISNFRSLGNVEVELGNLTVLIGSNNAGKTSFLDALFAAIGVGRKVLGAEDVRIITGEATSTCCFSTVCMSSNPTAQRVSAGSRRRPAQSSPS